MTRRRERKPRSWIFLITAFAVVLVVVIGLALFITTRTYVAYVDGQLISRASLEQRTRHAQFVYDLQAEGLGDPSFANKHKNEIIEQMVAEKLLRAESEMRGVLVELEEEEAYVSEVLTWVLENHFNASPEALSAALQEYDLDLPWLKEYLAESLWIFKLREQLSGSIIISDEDMKVFHAAHRADFDLPPAIRIRHLVVATRAEAERAWQELQSGKDFILLAREESLDASTKDLGGDLNWRVRGEFIPQFDDAAWDIEAVGQLSSVVETTVGFHVIKLEGKREAQERTFAEVSDGVKQVLFEAREASLWDDYLAVIRTQKRVIVFHP